MCLQIILHQPDPCCLWIPLFYYLFYKQGPVPLGLCGTHVHITLAGQRLRSHKYVHHAMTDVITVLPPVLSRLHGHFTITHLHQLLGRFVHAHHRKVLIVRLLVHVQHLFHSGYKSTVLLRRNHPFFGLPGLKLVFFSTSRTATCERLSTYFNSTILSASSRSDQRA